MTQTDTIPSEDIERLTQELVNDVVAATTGPAVDFFASGQTSHPAMSVISYEVNENGTFFIIDNPCKALSVYGSPCAEDQHTTRFSYAEIAAAHTALNNAGHLAPVDLLALEFLTDCLNNTAELSIDPSHDQAQPPQPMGAGVYRVYGNPEERPQTRVFRPRG